uniref:Uncharacterized protein n=1 Tax=Erythrolobus australicus TaxID=1077150 RepID=A0A7S1TKT1_9RHOD
MTRCALLSLCAMACAIVLVPVAEAQDSEMREAPINGPVKLSNSVLKLKASRELLEEYIRRHARYADDSAGDARQQEDRARDWRHNAKIGFTAASKASDRGQASASDNSSFASVRVTLSGEASRVSGARASSLPQSANPRQNAASHSDEQLPTAADLQRAHFGQSLCFSDDGNTFVVGANMFVQQQGAVIVYELDGARKASYVQSSADASENAGRSRRRRSLFGDSRVPTAWRETLLTVDDAGAFASSSRRHSRKARNPAYSASGGASGGLGGLGFACAITADGSALAISSLSGRGSSDGSGSMSNGFVMMFSRDAQSGIWQRRSDEITSQLDIPRHRKTNNAFGWALSASKDGAHLAVSAKGTWNHNGAVEIFTCRPGFEQCTYAQGLQPPDETNLVGPRGIRIRNNFGISIAMSADASTLVVGSTGYEYEQGVVYVYRDRRQSGLGDAGDSEPFVLSTRLFSGDAQRYGYFGFKVALDAQGLTLAAGADGEDEYRGAVYTFHRDSVSSEKWSTPVLLLKPDGERLQEDNFGGSVAIAGDGSVLVVGAPGAKLGDETDHGALYVYEALGVGKWELSRTLRRDTGDSRSGDLFAWSAGIDYEGARIAAGAPEADESEGVALLCAFRKSGRKNPSTESLVHDDIVNYYVQPDTLKPAAELDHDEL